MSETLEPILRLTSTFNWWADVAFLDGDDSCFAYRPTWPFFGNRGLVSPQPGFSYAILSSLQVLRCALVTFPKNGHAARSCKDSPIISNTIQYCGWKSSLERDNPVVALSQQPVKMSWKFLWLHLDILACPHRKSGYLTWLTTAKPKMAA